MDRNRNEGTRNPSLRQPWGCALSPQSACAPALTACWISLVLSMKVLQNLYLRLKIRPTGVRKSSSVSNSVWQSCPRSKEGSRGKQRPSITATAWSLDHLHQFSVAKSTSSYDFWISREEAEVFVAATWGTLLCCALALVNGSGKGNWGVKGKMFSLFKSRYLPITLS